MIENESFFQSIKFGVRGRVVHISAVMFTLEHTHILSLSLSLPPSLSFSLSLSLSLPPSLSFSLSLSLSLSFSPSLGTNFEKLTSFDELPG